MIFFNPSVEADIKFPPPSRLPMEFHRRLPAYATTPLHSLSSLAEELGVGKVFVKDESFRLGLPAFKILGASWATYREFCERHPELVHGWLTIDELAARIYDSPVLFAATDGNHGRAVARTARLFGLRSRVFVPKGTAQARIAGIESESAAVSIVDGTYDHAVAIAAREAVACSGIHIQDNSWPGYEKTARFVVEGYSTMMWEIDQQLRERNETDPTHVLVQIGNGSFADAVIRHYRAKEHQPIIVGVEPESAACLLESVKAGKMTKAPGPHCSMMVGMNCDSPSLISFPIIRQGMNCFVSIPDEPAKEAMRMFKRCNISSGETGAAGLGALLEMLSDDSDARKRLALDADSRVLLFSTEGITDPEMYQRIIG
ncbi:MAG: diaminopropionate ammonia-lyase [Ignavibacteriae bacterium]|nr:diaminopropionate ammonia-lyase [Ignavibacteriota bacterium]